VEKPEVRRFKSLMPVEQKIRKRTGFNPGRTTPLKGRDKGDIVKDDGESKVT